MRYLVFGLVLMAALGADARRGKRRKKGMPRAKTATVKADKNAAAVAGQTLKAGQDGRLKVAVLSLATLGIDKHMGASLDNYLRRSMQTIDNVDLISPVDIQIALRKDEEAATCGGGPKCAVRVGNLVRADVVVFGSVGGVGDAFNLNLRAMNVSTGEEMARQQASLSGTRHQLIPELRLAAYGLIAPHRIRGSLIIEIDVEGVEVEIDGKVVGVTPMPEAVKDLKPGPHLVVVKRPGYSQFQKELDIEPFVTRRIRIDLKKAEEAPAPP